MLDAGVIIISIEVYFILFVSRTVGLLESSICYYDLRLIVLAYLINIKY